MALFLTHDLTGTNSGWMVCKLGQSKISNELQRAFQTSNGGLGCLKALNLYFEEVVPLKSTFQGQNPKIWLWEKHVVTAV